MGEVWNGFLLGKARKEDVPCRFFAVRGMVMDIYSGSVFSLSLPSACSGSS